MIRHGTWEREWQNPSIVSNKICLPSVNAIKRYKQLKLNFDKMLGWQNFQKPQLQSVSIFFKFVHSFLFCICCVIFTCKFFFHENILQWCKSNKPSHVFFFWFCFFNFWHVQVQGKIRRLQRKEHLKISTITKIESDLLRTSEYIAAKL